MTTDVVLNRSLAADTEAEPSPAADTEAADPSPAAPSRQSFAATPIRVPAAATPVSTAATPPRLGDLLVSMGLITEQQRDDALAVQARTRSQLGAILVAKGAITPHQLFATLATVWGSEYAALPSRPVEESVFDGLDVEALLSQGWAPFGRDEDGTLVVVSSRRPTPLLHATVRQTLGDVPLRLVTGSDWRVSQAVQTGMKPVLLDNATMGLWRRRMSASARHVIDGRQKIVGIAAIIVLVGLIVAFPRPALATLSLVVSVMFLIGIAFKFVICMLGAGREHHEVVTQDEVAALVDSELPVYTVLVPCYREEKIVGQLVDNLGSLDYPAEKLEILLLLEADDEATINAARAGDPPHSVTIVVTPDGQPKTKPKACNVGLALARGEFLVIYDAEDRPDPDQLKRAVVAFRKARRGTVCVQAALNYFNADENLLTRMFTLEYSFWFDYMLPGLDAAKLPIPLGGTSNHFVTAKLRELGGWDPFNVTEDADLGIRASARGYRVGVIDSTTFEEANNAYGNWIRQRSRWIKGYMQTTLVHLRHPLELVREAGIVQAMSFCLLIGGTAASFLAVIPLYLLLVVSFFLPPSIMSPYFPGWVLWFSELNLLLGNGLMIWVSMMGAFRRRRYWLVLWALLNPLYWVMHSISAYKGLWQLITRPHYWEKTAHGLSHVDAAAAVAAEPSASRGVIPSPQK